MKETPVKVYVQEKRNQVYPGVQVYGTYPFKLLIGTFETIQPLLKQYEEDILYSTMEFAFLHPLMSYADYTRYDARIEKGAIIRERVTIEKNAVILMGAVLNVGAYIGEETMIDMNAVIGSNARIGKRCHVSAGAVISGTMEPQATTPVTIEDGVFIGANAVIFEGVTVHKGAIIGAGSIVTKDVPADVVVYGSPAQVVRQATKEDHEKVALDSQLRK